MPYERNDDLPSPYPGTLPRAHRPSTAKHSTALGNGTLTPTNDKEKSHENSDLRAHRRAESVEKQGDQRWQS